MKNQIKFRAQSITTREWAYGYVYVGIGETYVSYIIPEWIYNGYPATQDDEKEETLRFEKFTEVDPNTITRWTGMADKRGTDLYEGDIIAFENGNSIQTMGENSDLRLIEELVDTKQLGWKGSGYTFCEENCKSLCFIIGNKFENPDLLP